MFKIINNKKIELEKVAQNSKTREDIFQNRKRTLFSDDRAITEFTSSRLAIQGRLKGHYARQKRGSAHRHKNS